MNTIVLMCVLFGVALADYHRPGKYLEHDRTVVNCAKYKREANQHSCVLSTFNTEGPFFLPDDLQRSDITDGHVGLPLHLTINLVNANDCTPLENMYIHIWHTNASGAYSGVSNFGVSDLMDFGPDGPCGAGELFGPDGPFGKDGMFDELCGPDGFFSKLNGTFNPDDLFGPDGPFGENGDFGPDKIDFMANAGPGNNGMGGMRPKASDNDRFCRGYQITDSNGQVTFDTIIPGWYDGRSMHIHVEVYSKNSTEIDDITYVGQIFFEQELPYQLKLIDPYTTNTQTILLNDGDFVYMNHGNETLLDLQSRGNGYSGSVTFGINPYAVKAD